MYQKRVMNSVKTVNHLQHQIQFVQDLIQVLNIPKYLCLKYLHNPCVKMFVIKLN